MSRKRLPAITKEEARTIGTLLRVLRRSAGFRAVADAAKAPGCPCSMQTIYFYERGDHTPSLGQFLDLVEFYALGKRPSAQKAELPDLRSDEDLKAYAVAAISRVLAMKAYHVADAHELMARLQPPLPRRARGED